MKLTCEYTLDNSANIGIMARIIDAQGNFLKGSDKNFCDDKGYLCCPGGFMEAKGNTTYKMIIYVPYSVLRQSCKSGVTYYVYFSIFDENNPSNTLLEGQSVDFRLN